MQTVYEIRKNNLLLILSFYESRKAFCEKLGIEYNHLNQYLGVKSRKNIGDKFAAKVTEAHQLPIGWLDHVQDKLTVKNIVESQLATTGVAQNQSNQKNVENHPSFDAENTLRIVAISNILKMSKGENLEVSASVEEIKNISVPTTITNPIAYLIRGKGFAKPYRNGYCMVCEYAGEPIQGEEVLIFCKDGKIYAGEYLFEQDILIKIDSIDGEIDSILKEDIARISPVKMFISPSQINKE